jgi:hypothetical protein
MKRDDMVNVMLEFEREAQEYKCGRQFMSDLLKRMEEAGMLPPLQKVTTEDIYGNKFFVFKNRWDSE